MTASFLGLWWVSRLWTQSQKSPSGSPHPNPLPEGEGARKQHSTSSVAGSIFSPAIADSTRNPSMRSQSEAFFPLSLRAQPAIHPCSIKVKHFFLCHCGLDPQSICAQSTAPRIPGAGWRRMAPVLWIAGQARNDRKERNASGRGSPQVTKTRPPALKIRQVVLRTQQPALRTRRLVVKTWPPVLRTQRLVLRTRRPGLQPRLTSAGTS